MERRNVDGLVSVLYVGQLNRTNKRFLERRHKDDIRPSQGFQRELDDPDARSHRTDDYRLNWNTIESRRLANDAFRYRV